MYLLCQYSSVGLKEGQVQVGTVALMRWESDYVTDKRCC